MRLVAFLPFCLLAACQNYTTKPVCSDDNAVVPPGLTGVYTLSVQNEDFTTQTQEITVGVGKGKGSTFFRVNDGGDGAEEEGRVCEVNGFVIQESFDPEVKGYEQERLYVTNMGLTLLPVFYDKAELDAAGVRNKVFEMPERLRRVLGGTVAGLVERVATAAVRLFDGENTGLMIDNDGVPPRALMSFSKAGPLGVTLLRK